MEPSDAPLLPDNLPGEPPRPARFQPKSRSYKKLLLAAGAAVLLVAAALLILRITAGNKNTPAKNTGASAAKNPASVSSSPDTKKYKSAVAGLDLSFDYPDNWTVTTATDDKDPAIKYISVETPPSEFRNDKSTDVTGKAVILIRPRGADIAELAGDSSSISQDSQQLGYKNPSPNQHQYPYVSFVHFGGSRTSNNPFEEVIITGKNKFTANSVIGTGNIAGVDPLVSAAFYLCPDSTCAANGSGVLSITDATWQNNDTMKKVRALFESLVIN